MTVPGLLSQEDIARIEERVQSFRRSSFPDQELQGFIDSMWPRLLAHVRVVEAERDELREALVEISEYGGGDWEAIEARLVLLSELVRDFKEACDELSVVHSTVDEVAARFNPLYRRAGAALASVDIPKEAQ